MGGILKSVSAVSIFVDDLDRARRFYGEQAWGGTLAFLRDPDGNVLTLVG
jgi:hypothetical protein